MDTSSYQVMRYEYPINSEYGYLELNHSSLKKNSYYLTQLKLNFENIEKVNLYNHLVFSVF